MTTPLTPPPDVRARLEVAIARRPSPTRGQRASRMLLVIALSLVPVVILLVLRGVRAGGRPLGYVALVATGWSALVLAASLWTLRPGRSALGRSRPALALLGLGLPSSLLAVSVIASLALPETVIPPSYGWRVHFACAAMATVFSVAPVCCTLWLFQRSDPVKPWATGGALGAVAASWAGTVIAVQCPHPEPLHVALGHVGPIVVMAIVGALAGSRVLALRWIR